MNETPAAKTIIISGVNLVEAGPLAVFKDCLNNIRQRKSEDLTVIALVNSTALFSEFSNSNIVFVEYPEVKKRWFSRLVFEYYTCIDISKKHKPDVWLALHDITPNVVAKKRIVYCHNPSPFYKISLREALLEKSFFAFNLLYKFLYRINIQKNDFVVVQQSWIRDYFIKQYHVKNVIVAYPNVNVTAPKRKDLQQQKTSYRFLYPAFPRVFKNFEILFEAANQLQNTIPNFEIIVTFKGNENKYASHLLKKYGHITQIKFIGIQPRENVYKLYEECDCLVFPSKLETWGLPITEMKAYNKPIMVADCQYAHETVGFYDKACFFDPTKHIYLTKLMQNAINNTLVYNKTAFTLPKEPFTQSWQQLFDYFL